MLSKKKGELLFLLLILFVSIGTLWIASGYRATSRQFPNFVAILILILIVWELIVFIWKNLKAGEEKEKKTKKTIPREELIKRWITMLGALVFFVLFLRSLGFIITNAVFMVVILWVFGVRKIPVIVLIVAVVVGGLYIGFDKFLNVPLPKGTFISGLTGF